MPSTKNAFKPLAKNVLIPSRLKAVASARDAAIHKKTFRSGTRPSDLAKQTTLLISNEEMNDILKVVKSREESGLLIKGVSEIIKNEAKERLGGYFSMLLGKLNASLLGSFLTGRSTIRDGEDTIRAGQYF